MENADNINPFDSPKQGLHDIIKYKQIAIKEHFDYTGPLYPERILIMSSFINMDME